MSKMTNTLASLNEAKKETTCPSGSFVRADLLFDMFDALIKDLDTKQPNIKSILKGLMEVMKTEGLIENYTFETCSFNSVLKLTPENSKREIYFGFKE